MNIRNLALQRLVTLAALAIGALVVPAAARDLTGTVVAISDGDTLTLLADRVQHKIRLAEIDAPESGQAFGTRSRQALAGLCFQKSATVKVSATDRYGRTVGRVACAGRDASLAQVASGMAWVFPKYAKDRQLYDAEDKARAAGAGLWTDKAPVSPWEWRARQRHRE